MKQYIQIELNKSDIAKLVAEKYGLDINQTSVSINYTKGDYPYGSDHVSIIVKGEPIKTDNKIGSQSLFFYI
jgi:hypothetical protein